MRIYARREDDDNRVLVEIQCDARDCDATLKPGPHVASSGWKNVGARVMDSRHEYDLCDEHADRVVEFERDARDFVTSETNG